MITTAQHCEARGRLVITRESLRGSPHTMITHTRLPAGGAMFEARCDRFPRLVKHYYRGRRTAVPTITWSVDGHRCVDLDEAIRLLNGPVIPDERFEAVAS